SLLAWSIALRTSTASASETTSNEGIGYSCVLVGRAKLSDATRAPPSARALRAVRARSYRIVRAMRERHPRRPGSWRDRQAAPRGASARLRALRCARAALRAHAVPDS